MEMDKETQMEIGKLQMIEQKLQSVIMQKQNFQSNMLEVENAIIELKNAETAYKIVGNIMISSTKDDLNAELKEKKELFEEKIKTLEKQENKLKEDSKVIREKLEKLSPKNE
ncbi:prefoldin subunit beta [archaeon]|mgnify:CR=1 FL=1|jgi:prefoldin beta subunit|nr:prefoldin subunit beta [archaeon]MBT7107402.1 prefoldin subunit beta [archaeon]MBT7297204.1 prefoldin subunit beta [archaeon]